MRTLLTESRIEIPNFDNIWDVYKQAVEKEIAKTRPIYINNVFKLSLFIRNIKAPVKSFFSYLNTRINVILVDENDNIPDDYNEGEINPNIRLDNTGRIGNLLIDIRVMSTQENILDTIFPIFHHELTHAYEYYGKLKKGVSTNNLRDDSTYDIRMFNSIIKNPNLKPLEKNLASLIYFSDPSEYNGWINTFYSEIYKMDVKNTDYRTIIANTTTWKRIAFLNNVVNLMKQVQKTEDQQKLMRINNILTNQRVKDYQTLVNETEQRYQKLRFDCVKEFVEIINKRRIK